MRLGLGVFSVVIVGMLALGRYQPGLFKNSEPPQQSAQIVKPSPKPDPSASTAK
jgi:hypothetical protein